MVALFWAVSLLIGAAQCRAAVLPYGDGFRGIWMAGSLLDSPYKFLYSGGYPTYPQQMNPFAYYAAEVDKTFFVYGGTNEGNTTLYHTLSYFDHTTGQVARPRILLDKNTINAHDNPTIMLDEAGYIYVFSNSHGTTRPSYIHRSVEPYSIDEFELALTLPRQYNFSYSQPHYIDGEGFLFLHTQYIRGRYRQSFYNTSSDGVDWDYAWEDRPAVVALPGGRYQISGSNGQVVGLAASLLPSTVPSDRTNLYYIETGDMGQTWRTADQAIVAAPITEISSPSLVHDYATEGLKVGLKDVRYDADGRPVILYNTTPDWYPGPGGGPRVWHTAHFDGSDWTIKDAFESDHAYDHGSLSIEEDGLWRIIAPTEPGPRPFLTGGDMAMWTSRDEGDTWQMTGVLTQDSRDSHTYARRPVNAHDEFYSFWGAADPLFRGSRTSMYFTDRAGTGVWRLPRTMDEDFATPELAFAPKPALTSAADGNWRDAATWHAGSGVPTGDHSVVIRGHTVAADGSIDTSSSLTINGGGSLTLGLDATAWVAENTQIGNGILSVAPGGRLLVGGNLSMDRSSTYTSEIAATSNGLIAVFGDAHIGGKLNLPVVGVGDPGPFSRTVVATAGNRGIVGRFDELSPGHLDLGVFLRDIEYAGPSWKVTRIDAHLYTASGGDSNGDGNVDGQDVWDFITHFDATGNTAGHDWADGDTAGGRHGRGDGILDGQDIFALIANFTGDPGPPEWDPPDSGAARAEYDWTTGEFRASVSGVMGWHFVSDGLFNSEMELPGRWVDDLTPDATNLVSFNANTVGESRLFATLGYTDLELGALIDPAPDRREMEALIAGNENAELKFVYIGGWGAEPRYAPIRIVPEANVTAMLLGGLAGLLLLRRRLAGVAARSSPDGRGGKT